MCLPNGFQPQNIDIKKIITMNYVFIFLTFLRNPKKLSTYKQKILKRLNSL